MSDDGPVAKLVHLMLIALHRKGAIRAIFRRAAVDAIVELELPDGRVVDELEIPAVAFPNVIRRLALISNMPFRRAGEIGTSQIHLVLHDTEHLRFDIEISGAGLTERAVVRPT